MSCCERCSAPGPLTPRRVRWMGVSRIWHLCGWCDEWVTTYRKLPAVSDFTPVERTPLEDCASKDQAPAWRQRA